MTEWLKILLEHDGYEVRTALIGTRGEEIFKTWQPDVGRHRHDAAGRRRHRAASPVQADRSRIPRSSSSPATAACREAVEAIKAGAFVLPREADRAPTRCSRCSSSAIERKRLVDENEQLKQKLAGPLPVRQHHRQEQEDAGAVRAGRERGGQRRQHPDPGRERHRQGADRQRDPLQQQARRRARSSRSTARRFPRT